MLKLRIITAVCMLSVFLCVLFILPWLGFVVFVSAVALVGAWEWANLSSFETPLKRIVYVVFIFIVMFFVGINVGLDKAVISAQPIVQDAVKNILLAAGAWWAIALLWVQGYPSSAVLWGSKWVRALMGCFVLIPMWLSVIYLDQFPHGPWLVLLVLAVVVAADTGAYFFGRAFGKRKLAVEVSPGKSWEGFFGGLFCTGLLALGVAVYVGLEHWKSAFLILLITSLLSVLGDLLESMVKRHRDIKDSGKILPGHGGVLDRIDSVTAAAPIFVLGLILSGWLM